MVSGGHIAFAIVPLLLALVGLLLVVGVGGFILGWSFRKGWDRAGR